MYSHVKEVLSIWPAATALCPAQTANTHTHRHTQATGTDVTACASWKLAANRAPEKKRCSQPTGAAANTCSEKRVSVTSDGFRSSSFTPCYNQTMTGETKKKNRHWGHHMCPLTPRVHFACLMLPQSAIRFGQPSFKRSREASVSGVSTHLDLVFHSLCTVSGTLKPYYVQLCNFRIWFVKTNKK